MATNLQQIIDDAKDEFQECLMEGVQYPEDAIAEIADSAVPIYYHEIAYVAQSDIGLLLDEPELGAASGDNFTGMQGTAIAYIAANIYEAVSNALFEVLYEFQQQKEAS